MTKMLSASGGFAPLTRGSAPEPRWGLRTRHGAPQPLTLSAAYGLFTESLSLYAPWLKACILVPLLDSII